MYYNNNTNNGFWLKDPIKRIEIEEVKTNNMIYFCREQMYADGFVKGVITKEEYKIFLNKK